MKASMLFTDLKVKPKISITQLYITDNLFASVGHFNELSFTVAEF